MKSSTQALIQLLLITGVHASVKFSNLVVRESITSAPDGFTQVSPAPADQILNLRIALANSNMDGLMEVFYAVSTPGNPSYGQHLSKEEVEEYVRPTNETTLLVNEFLQLNNISAETISPAGDWLAFTLPVSQANALFGANYSVFKHQSGAQITRTLSYSIPVELQGHLELVHPSISFDVPVSQPASNLIRLSPTSQNATSSKLGARQSVPGACTDQGEIGPSCLQALYGIPTAPATQSSNHIAIAGLTDQIASDNDLQTYFKALRPDLTGFTFSVLSVDGGENSQNTFPSPEANAYVQIAAGLASKVPMTFIIVGSKTSDGPLDGMLDLANTLLAQNSPPQVLSSSYSQNENTVSAAAANQLCNAFMQLGARGVSVLIMSGNGGVSGAGEQSNTCTDFVPTFPSSCPFVTAVGSTFNIPETASPLSAGGFSNIFSQPLYQATAVEDYLLSIGSANAGLFNAEGRGIPDVSALGMNTQFVWDGDFVALSGTDLATSVFASVIALLNDDLISQGKPAMGFLNPFIYSSASEVPIFNDITKGSNAACKSNGFFAIPGWDPVTGLGTPNFPNLRSFARSSSS